MRLPSAGDEAGIGGGIPEGARSQLAHKNGVTFEGDLGVVADGGVVEADGTAYVIVVIANQVNWSDRDAAMNVITRISGLVYQEFEP